MAFISGKVTDNKGTVIPGTLITATNTQNEIYGPVSTDGNTGVYTTPDLPDGNYTVKVNAPAGYEYPAPTKLVPVTDGKNVPDINFTLVAGETGSISGKVTEADKKAVQGVKVKATNTKNEVSGEWVTDAEGKYIIQPLPVGTYKVEVEGDREYSTRFVAVYARKNTSEINLSKNLVVNFLETIEDDLRFSIEAPISEQEAEEAASLFSVVNLMLAGLSQRQVGGEQKIDMLGVLNLYYSLQDRTLENKLVVEKPGNLWSVIETDLKKLAKELDQLQSDVDFLNQEAKRQFNLGTSTSVVGNAQFPGWFKRYVEIGTDPLLSIDIKKAEDSEFFDKTKLAQAYDLLRDLKGLLLQIVRSLSKSGTIATKRVNEDWAGFEARALKVLTDVAKARVSPDQDDLTPWAVLAVLTGKNRETQIAPYVALARHGGKLLRIAFEDIYLKSKDRLEDFDRDHLLDLFQPQRGEFLTTRIRKEAAVIRRYPLANWG